jgi:hypothetical protein
MDRFHLPERQRGEMAYTLGISVVDPQGLTYPTGTPPLAGTLSLSTSSPPATATSGGTPAMISFNVASPPFLSRTLLLTDPTGPGDVFRSGPIINWPSEPASINAYVVPVSPVPGLPGFAGVGHYSYSQLGSLISSKLPVFFDVPWYATLACWLATGFKFSPGRVWISSISFMQSTTGPGIIRAVFGGFIDDPAGENGVNYTGSVDLKPAPSGDANDPTNIIQITAFNLSLTIDPAAQLVAWAVVGILANFFASNLSGPISDRLNEAIASAVVGINIPGLTSTWTISARSITVLAGGVTVQTIAADLPRPRLLMATVTPQPAATATGVDYTVTVEDAVTRTPIAGATVTLNNFSQTGAPASVTHDTDMNGQAPFPNIALHTKRTIIHTGGGTNRAGKPEHDFDYGSESPTIAVKKNGYVDLKRPLF